MNLFNLFSFLLQCHMTLIPTGHIPTTWRMGEKPGFQPDIFRQRWRISETYTYPSAGLLTGHILHRWAKQKSLPVPKYLEGNY